MGRRRKRSSTLDTIFSPKKQHPSDKGREVIPVSNIGSPELILRGFHVLRYWNNDILSNSTGVLEHLLSVLAAPPHPAASGRHPLPQGERGRPSKIKVRISEFNVHTDHQIQAQASS
jgi:hypothetical protein